MAPPPPHAHEGDSNPADEMNDIPGAERHGNWTVVQAKRRAKAMSFYLCDGVEPGNRFKIFVSAVEKQLRYARSLRTKVKSDRGTPYPHGFKNKDELDLATPGHERLQEFPLHESSNFADGDKPGAVRVVYNGKGYDVVYHNPKKQGRGKQADGAMRKVAPFVKARRVSRRADRRASV